MKADPLIITQPGERGDLYFRDYSARIRPYSTPYRAKVRPYSPCQGVRVGPYYPYFSLLSIRVRPYSPYYLQQNDRVGPYSPYGEWEEMGFNQPDQARGGPYSLLPPPAVALPAHFGG